MKPDNPFHAGEIEAQQRAGVGDVASKVAGFIRDFMPEQHREFHTSLPFLIVSAAAPDGRPWVTLIEGNDGFVTSPSETRLEMHADLSQNDPLAAALHDGADIGLLGIEFATRRRNRLSGFMRWRRDRFVIDVRQTFGNCPQYIHPREWYRTAHHTESTAERSPALSPQQIERIGAADTMFIGTGQRDKHALPSNGYDASHRGGEPGFVQVVDRTHLRIPDYAGNNFFNSIGNILRNPNVGLVFVDFTNGDLLHVTGRATIDWAPDGPGNSGALRFIDVEVGEVLDRRAALSLRWSSDANAQRDLRVTKKDRESEQITSVYLAPADDRPLRDFKPGQHLPIQLDVPGQRAPVQRSYSLSGPAGSDFYRLSVKREARGVASRHLHDRLQVGDIIRAHDPAGSFVVPCGRCPLVLASAGVGVTPMMSILLDVARGSHERPVWFVHGARDGGQHALRGEVERVAREYEHVQKQFFYSRPRASDQHGIDYDVEGRVNVNSLLDLEAGPDAHYMLCGPAAFVSSLETGLQTAGVPGSQIHFETF